MPKLKDLSQKKVQMTFRIEPKVAERLKKITKFHSKISLLLNFAIKEYERLEEEDFVTIEKGEEIYKINSFFTFPKESLKNKAVRNNLINVYKNKIYELKKHDFYEFEMVQDKIKKLEFIIEFLENWE